MCRDHICACQNHNVCGNYTLRVEITLVRARPVRTTTKSIQFINKLLFLFSFFPCCCFVFISKQQQQQKIVILCTFLVGYAWALRACRNHNRECHNHTHTCQNHTLRVKITLVHVEITVVSV
jgi:hypothetical protein